MNPIHISDLKQFAQSAAHFESAVCGEFEQTRSMKIGTLVHNLVLGSRPDRPYAVFDGDRRGTKAWDAFVALNAGKELFTQPEQEEAHTIAEAVSTDPVAAPLIFGTRREVPLKWMHGDVPCETGGLDIVGDGFIADLKTTQSAEPNKFKKLCLNMLYHAQLAWYQNAARANGIVADNLYIIGVETRKPYPVTVLKLSPGLIELGHKSIALWLEQLRQCQDSNFYPGYTQSIVDFDVPLWMTDDEEEDGEEVVAE